MREKGLMKNSVKKPLSARTRGALWGYGFIAIWLIGFFVFTVYPTVYSFIISLNDVRLTSDGMLFTWRGLYHYRYAISVSGDFKLAITQDLGFIVCATIVVVVFSLIIALLLNKNFPLRTFFRVVFFLPVVIMSGPVISRLLTGDTADFSGQATLLYAFLSDMPKVLQTPTLFVLDNLVKILWFSGVQILIYLAGLQKISPDIYEAASIDGAGAWEKFWKITLPHMRSIALLNAIYTVVEISNYPSLSVNTLISRHLFNQTRIYSYSAAMSWLYFVIVAVLLGLVFLVFKLFGRKDA